MSKAFTRESDAADDDSDDGATGSVAPALPAGARNYITRGGLQRLRDELQYLLHTERPAVTAVVSWAAGNGDRSENADYQYGKRRLREIDRRLRFLDKRIAAAEPVDPAQQKTRDRVFFGATVTYVRADDREVTVTIVGTDETESGANRISWISPVARALMKAGIGDTVTLRSPNGAETLEVVAISYPPVA